MPAPHRAHAEFPCPDAATADAVRQAMGPELADAPPGARLGLEQEGPLLRLHVEADDVGALRASLQSAVRLLDAALAVLAAPAAERGASRGTTTD